MTYYDFHKIIYRKFCYVIFFSKQRVSHEFERIRMVGRTFGIKDCVVTKS